MPIEADRPPTRTAHPSATTARTPRNGTYALVRPGPGGRRCGHSGDPIDLASTANRRGSRILPYALNGTSAIRPAAASRAFWGACSGTYAVSPSAPEPSLCPLDAGTAQAFYGAFGMTRTPEFASCGIVEPWQATR
jgi:hypothetical protein